MKKLILNITLILTLFFIVEKPFGLFISKYIKEKQVDNRIELITKSKVVSNTIILGSSRAASDLTPEVMMFGNDLDVYNLGFSGSNLSFHSAVLEILLNYHVPKRLILVLDGPGTFIPNGITVFRKDKLYSYLSNDFVLRQLCENSNKHYISAKLSWLYRENQNLFPVLEYFRYGKEPLDYTNAIDSFGHIPLPLSEFHVDETEYNVESYNLKLENQKLIKSFKQIQSICMNKEIQLIVVSPPLLKSRENGFHERLQLLLHEKVMFYDYTDLIKDKNLYFDNGHLNAEGSKVFSKQLAQDILNGI